MKTLIILLFLIMTITGCSSRGGFGHRTNNFIGYWTTDGSSTRTVIFNDKYKKVQMVIFDSRDGEVLDIPKLALQGDTLKSTEKTASTGWVTYDSYTLEDDNTIKCVIGGDAKGSIIYLKRVK